MGLKKIKIRYVTFLGSIFLFIFLISELLKIEKNSKKNDVIPENIQKINYYKKSNDLCYKSLGIKEISDIAKLSVLEINTMKNSGSGFVVSHGKESSLILTNSHVVNNNKTVMVKWTDGTTDIGKVVYDGKGDKLNDLALIELNKIKGNVLKLKIEDLSIGEEVISVGYPKGLGFSITRGIISGLRSDNKIVQTDAAINQGNSGGPLIDSSGCVVGVNTFIFKDAEGLNFAISGSHAQEFVQEFINKPKEYKLVKEQKKQSKSENFSQKNPKKDFESKSKLNLEFSSCPNIEINSNSFKSYLYLKEKLVFDFEEIDSTSKAKEVLFITCQLLSSNFKNYNFQVFLKRAVALNTLGLNNEAIFFLKRAASLSTYEKDLAAVYYEKAKVYSDLKNNEKACKSLNISAGYGYEVSKSLKDKYCI